MDPPARLTGHRAAAIRTTALLLEAETVAGSMLEPEVTAAIRRARTAAEGRIDPPAEPEPDCYCTEYAGPCYKCVDRAEALVGARVRDRHGREWTVEDHDSKDTLATVKGGTHWAPVDDVTVLEAAPA